MVSRLLTPMISSRRLASCLSRIAGDVDDWLWGWELTVPKSTFDVGSLADAPSRNGPIGDGGDSGQASEPPETWFLHAKILLYSLAGPACCEE